MKRIHNIAVEIDAARGEAEAKPVMLDGELYWVTVTPYAQKQALEQRVTKLNERMDKEGISLGPMNSAKCPLCGR